MTPKSILIYLDSNVKLFTYGFVNQNEHTDDLELIAQVDREEKNLNLFAKFESVWAGLNNHFELSQKTTIYYLIGPHAGFTDTRVIYLWLKSWEMFEGGRYVIEKLENDLDLNKLSAVQLTDLLKKIDTQNQQELLYSTEPRIGVK
jgi:hypothetical protein